MHAPYVHQPVPLRTRKSYEPISAPRKSAGKKEGTMLWSSRVPALVESQNEEENIRRSDFASTVKCRCVNFESSICRLCSTFPHKFIYQRTHDRYAKSSNALIRETRRLLLRQDYAKAAIDLLAYVTRANSFVVGYLCMKNIAKVGIIFQIKLW